MLGWILQVIWKSPGTVKVTIIGTKFLGPAGGYVSDAIGALDYLTDRYLVHPAPELPAHLKPPEGEGRKNDANSN